MRIVGLTQKRAKRGTKDLSVSPFADALRRVRFSKGLRQQDLADLMNCQRSYVSALESDLRQAPPEEFVGRLCAQLQLSASETRGLRQARIKSQRVFVVPTEVPPASFELVFDLFERLSRLSDPQLRALSAILEMPGLPVDAPQPSEGRIRRRDRRSSTSGHGVTSTSAQMP